MFDWLGHFEKNNSFHSLIYSANNHWVYSVLGTALGTKESVGNERILYVLYLPGIFARNIWKVLCNCHSISVRYLLWALFHRIQSSLKQVWGHTGENGNVENMSSISKKLNIYWGQHPLIQKVCNECLVCAWHKEDDGLALLQFLFCWKASKQWRSQHVCEENTGTCWWVTGGYRDTPGGDPRVASLRSDAWAESYKEISDVKVWGMERGG